MARVLVLGSVMFVVVSADSSGDVRLPSDRRSQEEWQRDWYERNRFRLGVPPLSSNPIPFDRSPKRNVAGNANDISSSIEIGKTDGKSRLLIPRKVAMQIMQAEPGFPGTPQNGGTTGNKRSTGSGVLPPMSTSTIGALRTTIVGVLMSLALCSCVLLRSRPRLLGSVGVLALMAMAATLWHADSAHGDLPVKGWFGWKRQPGRGIRDVRTPWQHRLFPRTTRPLPRPSPSNSPTGRTSCCSSAMISRSSNSSVQHRPWDIRSSSPATRHNCRVSLFSQFVGINRPFPDQQHRDKQSRFLFRRGPPCLRDSDRSPFRRCTR